MYQDETRNEATQAPDLASRAMALSLSISSAGVERKVNARQAIKEAKEEAVARSKVSARFCKVESYEAIGKRDRAVGAEVRRMAVPSPLFRSGIYMIPDGLVDRVDTLLQEYAVERGALVERFLEDWPAERFVAMDELSDYGLPESFFPTASDLRPRFAIAWQWLGLDIAPARLESINADVFREARERAEEAWGSALDASRVLMREECRGLVAALEESLTPKEDGKRRRFYGSRVDSMREWLGTFPFRDVTDDAELDQLTSRMREVLSGVTVDDLRSDDGTRNTVREGMARIRESLEGLVSEAPERSIVL